MPLKIQSVKSLPTKTDTLILPIFEGDTLKVNKDHLDTKTAKFIKHATNNAPAFKGKSGQTLSIILPEGSATRAALILGLGKKKGYSAKTANAAGVKLYAALKTLGAGKSAITAKALNHVDEIALAASLQAYRFTPYKEDTKDAPPLPQSLALIGADKSTYNAAVAEGITFARDLVNEAPNTLFPDAYAKLIKKTLKPLGVEIDILDEKAMTKMGMGAIMAVGKGSERQPRIVIMRWNGLKGKTAKSTKPLALVGKGVTFDTGGISLKPGANMDEMKMDMAGSAAVVGTMLTLATRKAKANVVGIVGLAENMPSHNAYRPGDIITSYSGKTIEVLNTDAEGRLVLADCLTYVQEKYDPSAIIDLATLTGAILVALGQEYCGTFTDDDTLWGKLDKAAASAQEKIWRMPLDEVWTKEVTSNIADLRNLGKSRHAGASTAAAFLGHFIDKGRPWAHMDIAGTAWLKNKSATGFGVRTLDELVKAEYEG